jgi:hypothetical protein
MHLFSLLLRYVFLIFYPPPLPPPPHYRTTLKMTWLVACVSTFRGRSVTAFATPLFTKPTSFFRQKFSSSANSILRSATLASSVDLEKSLQVTHPAFEVVEKDVVEEYGAYCTLYRHKKSGAELLSVASEDDNKVRSLRTNERCLLFLHESVIQTTRIAC